MECKALAAILAFVLLASPATGSPSPARRRTLRGLDEQQKSPPPLPAPPVSDGEPLNRSHTEPAGVPPPLPGGSRDNSTASPGSPPVENPPSKQQSPRLPPPVPPPLVSSPPVQSPPDPLSQTPSGGGTKPSPSRAGVNVPPEGSKGGGEGKRDGDGSEVGGKCSGATWQCSGNVTACLWHPENDHHQLFILVQNKGNESVDVSVSSPTEIGPSTVSKSSFKKFNISHTLDDIPKRVILKVGGKYCSRNLMSPVPVDTFLQQLTTYATPEYGVYAVFLTVFVAGGMWACCKCRKRSREVNSGIPYHQLEMGVQDSTTVVATNAEEGWDDGWGEGWEDEDEESGSKPNEASHGGSAAGNGTATISTKPSVRDEWEDWDD